MVRIMQKTTHRLSTEAMNDLRTIVEKEIGEVMADSEIEEMGIRVLGLFSLLMTLGPGRALIQPELTGAEGSGFYRFKNRTGQGTNYARACQSGRIQVVTVGTSLAKKANSEGMDGEGITTSPIQTVRFSRLIRFIKQVTNI